MKNDKTVHVNNPNTITLITFVEYLLSVLLLIMAKPAEKKFQIVYKKYSLCLEFSCFYGLLASSYVASLVIAFSTMGEVPLKNHRQNHSINSRVP